MKLPVLLFTCAVILPHSFTAPGCHHELVGGAESSPEVQGADANALLKVPVRWCLVPMKLPMPLFTCAVILPHSFTAPGCHQKLVGGAESSPEVQGAGADALLKVPVPCSYETARAAIYVCRHPATLFHCTRVPS